MDQITYTTVKGSEILVSVHRNRQLTNGGDWIKSAYHTLTITCNGTPHGYKGLITDPAVGLAIKTLTALIPVPTDLQSTIKSWAAEYEANNASALKAELAAEAEYETHNQAVTNAMTLNGGTY